MTNNSVNPDTIFANNEMSLQDIEIYGFDYDYTLAFYSHQLHNLIFNIARDNLITKLRVGSSQLMSSTNLMCSHVFVLKQVNLHRCLCVS